MDGSKIKIHTGYSFWKAFRSLYPIKLGLEVSRGYGTLTIIVRRPLRFQHLRPGHVCLRFTDWNLDEMRTRLRRPHGILIFHVHHLLLRFITDYHYIMLWDLLKLSNSNTQSSMPKPSQKSNNKKYKCWRLGHSSAFNFDIALIQYFDKCCFNFIHF